MVLQVKTGQLKPGCFGEIDPETVTPTLVFAGHLGGGVAELLLNVALVDLGRRGETGAQRMPGKLLPRSPSLRSPRTPAANAARLTSRATS